MLNQAKPTATANYHFGAQRHAGLKVVSEPHTPDVWLLTIFADSAALLDKPVFVCERRERVYNVSNVCKPPRRTESDSRSRFARLCVCCAAWLTLPWACAFAYAFNASARALANVAPKRKWMRAHKNGEREYVYVANTIRFGRHCWLSDDNVSRTQRDSFQIALQRDQHHAWLTNNIVYAFQYLCYYRFRQRQGENKRK